MVAIRIDLYTAGNRLEDMIPSPRDRTELFREIDGYSRAMLNYMMMRSDFSWERHAKHRENIGFAGTDEREIT